MPGYLRRRADPLHEPPATEQDSPAPASGHHFLLDLQRSAGNAAVARLLRPGGGALLDAATREDMEARFGGADFGAVRVHTGPEAQTSAERVGAEAYTVGSDIVLRRAALDAADGRHLLAHELTHVLQQRGAPAGGELTVSDPGDRFERQAADTADRVTAGGMAPPADSAGAAVVQREPTQPRAATGAASIADLEASTAKLGPGRVTAGLLARTEWESLFARHFTEPDKVEDMEQSSHARYFFSKMYGWIDAQHFFAHIQFAEDAGPARATREGLEIEVQQDTVRHLIGPSPHDTSIYSDLLEHNLMNADDFVHYREGTFMAISAAMTFLNPQQKALVAGFDERQVAKLILDNAVSAWSYEDLASNQLGVQFFRLYGAYVNDATDPAEVRLRFVARLRSFFADIGVVEDAAEVRRLAAGLPGKERWTAPKMGEAEARKRFPELFALGGATHQVRTPLIDQRSAAETLRDAVRGYMPSLTLRVESYGKGWVIYGGPVSLFEAVVGKFLFKRFMGVDAEIEPAKSHTP